MSTIYGCATITIVALNGRDANSGLAGISAPRSTQVKETIGGRVLFTTAASLRWEMNEARNVWPTRAWTFQEEQLSRRIVYFTSGQGVFTCVRGDLEEDFDLATFAIDAPSHRMSSKAVGIFAPVRKTIPFHYQCH